MTSIEVAPGNTYSCDFTVHIKDTDLPDLSDTVTSSKELYDDVIKAVLKDKNEDPVGPSTDPNDPQCPADLGAGAGDNCSAIKTVEVTNVPPTITVTKTVDTDQVTEGTHEVTYTVVIENDSTVNTVDAVEITGIKDSVNEGTPVDLTGDADCQVGTILAVGASCSFTYTASLTGNTGDVILNTVTATAKDNENDTDEASDGASVTFTNSPGAITLVKIPDDEHVTESGEDVIFTFTIQRRRCGVDEHHASPSLTDDKFGVLIGDCQWLPRQL